MDPAPDEGEGEGEGGAAAASSSQAAEEARPVSQQQPQPQPLSRYELQKRRDWNTFLQYLRNHKPPLTLPRCSGAHVIEFLKYLDQFGKTKVHADACAHFGQPNPPAPCACPLRQAWGSLDALIGRLRAAYDESGGRPDSNPFAARAVRIYLREVREAQAKARGIPYDKKKRKRAASGSTSAAVAAPPPVITAEAAGPSEGDHEEKPPQPTEQTEKSTTMVAPPHASTSANTTSGSAGASSSTSAAATVTTTMTATAAAAVGKEAMPPQGPAPPSS